VLCHCLLGGKKSRVLVYKINLTSAISNDFSLGSLWRPGLTWIDWQNRLVKLSSLCVGSSGTATQNQTYSQKLLHPCQSIAMFTRSLSLSLSLSLSRCFKGHFSMWTSVSPYKNVSILDFIEAKDDGCGEW